MSEAGRDRPPEAHMTNTGDSEAVPRKDRAGKDTVSAPGHGRGRSILLFLSGTMALAGVNIAADAMSGPSMLPDWARPRMLGAGLALAAALSFRGLSARTGRVGALPLGAGMFMLGMGVMLATSLISPAAGIAAHLYLSATMLMVLGGMLAAKGRAWP